MECRTPWPVRFRSSRRVFRVWAGLLVVTGCQSPPAGGPVTVIFPSSTLGAEGTVLRRQLARFMQEHPDIRVVQRSTPDAADQRHQLYVQWLNAHIGEPDILQLDAIWTPEFAAAEWILPLDRFRPAVDSFFPATIAANTWQGHLYGMPWFVDVGMLYWRTDLMRSPPATFAELEQTAAALQAENKVRYGLVFQGARYEGLVTVFTEYLGAHGGKILDGGRVTVASPAGIAALTEMRDQIYRESIVPQVTLTWHEEEARFAFQNGDAAFMRNWPYPYAFMNDSASSRVAGRYARGADARRLRVDGRPRRSAARSSRSARSAPILMRRGPWWSTSRARNRCSNGPASSASSRPVRRSIAIPGSPRRSRCRSIRLSPWWSTPCRGPSLRSTPSSPRFFRCSCTVR